MWRAGEANQLLPIARLRAKEPALTSSRNSDTRFLLFEIEKSVVNLRTGIFRQTGRRRFRRVYQLSGMPLAAFRIESGQ